MQCSPRFSVDFSFQRCLERTIRIVRAEEVRMPYEEALLVVVGVNEPACDAIGTVTADFARLRVEDVYAVHFHTNLGSGRNDGDIRLAEDDEQITLPCVLEFIPHMQVGVHSGLEDRNPAEFAE